MGSRVHGGETAGPRTRARVGSDERCDANRNLRTDGARDALLRLYYFATPAFFLVDWLWGISVRASFLPSGDLRLVYYAFCAACAVVCHRRPDLTPFVGIGESAANLLLLALGVMLPIWSLSDAVLAGDPLPRVMTPAKLINVLLSGSILVLAFHRSQSRLLRRQ